jgi:hypothetical protein
VFPPTATASDESRPPGTARGWPFLLPQSGTRLSPYETALRLGRQRFEGERGLGQEPADELGPILDASGVVRNPPSCRPAHRIWNGQART